MQVVYLLYIIYVKKNSQNQASVGRYTMYMDLWEIHIAHGILIWTNYKEDIFWRVISPIPQCWLLTTRDQEYQKQFCYKNLP